MEIIRCPECGYAVYADNPECSSCGRPIEHPQGPPPAFTPKLVPAGLVLCVVGAIVLVSGFGAESVPTTALGGLLFVLGVGFYLFGRLRTA